MFTTTDCIALLPAWNKNSFLALLEVKATRNRKKWQQTSGGRELGGSPGEAGLTPNEAREAGQELHKEVSSLTSGFTPKAHSAGVKIPFLKEQSGNSSNGLQAKAGKRTLPPHLPPNPSVNRKQYETF